MVWIEEPKSYLKLILEAYNMTLDVWFIYKCDSISMFSILIRGYDTKGYFCKVIKGRILVSEELPDT